MRQSIKKHFLSTLFFIVLLFLTVWYIFHDENLGQVFFLLGTARTRYVIPAVLFVIAFILGESVVIHYLLKSLGEKVKFFHCCLFSFTGFFYSAITPSASGGQPMQIIAMRRAHVSGAVSTVVLGIVTITYKLVLVLIGAAVLILRPASIMLYLEDVESLVYLGLALNVAFIAFLLLAVFNPTLLRTGARLLFSLINRIRPYSNPDKVMNRLDATLRNYSGTAHFFRNHPLIIFNVFLITLVQRLCLFSIVWFTYRAFNLFTQNAAVVILLYAMISVAVDMLPLPGGIGISETMFLTIFEPIFGQALVLPGMILCRGISYYTQLLISAIMTGAAHFILRDKE